MTTEELKTALRQVSEIMRTQTCDVKKTDAAICILRLTQVVEDDDFVVTPDVFADLDTRLLKTAIAGLAFILAQTFQSERTGR